MVPTSMNMKKLKRLARKWGWRWDVNPGSSHGFFQHKKYGKVFAARENPNPEATVKEICRKMAMSQEEFFAGPPPVSAEEKKEKNKMAQDAVSTPALLRIALEEEFGINKPFTTADVRRIVEREFPDTKTQPSVVFSNGRKWRHIPAINIKPAVGQKPGVWKLVPRDHPDLEWNKNKTETPKERREDRLKEKKAGAPPASPPPPPRPSTPPPVAPKPKPEPTKGSPELPSKDEVKRPMRWTVAGVMNGMPILRHPEEGLYLVDEMTEMEMEVY